MDNKLQENIIKVISDVCEDICDNLCKYRETADDEFICDLIRERGSCPLDILH